MPFSRVLLAVNVEADHTGCIYLGAFDGTSDYPVAVYGGPEDAGFTWRLLADGTVLLSDPVTGETYALARTRGDGSSYGRGMTNVAITKLKYTKGKVTATNAKYSGKLKKANAKQKTNIKEKLQAVNTPGDDTTNVTPLTVKALTNGTVKVDIYGTLSTGMKYSLNGGEKTLITTSTDIPVSAGDSVQFYGNGTSTQTYYKDSKVKIQGSGAGFTCKAYGNTMSLLDETNFATKTDLPNESNIFRELFYGNIALTDASGLLLPATTLVTGCYYYMFYGCTNLNYVKCLATSGISANKTYQWLKDVAATGTFHIANGVLWAKDNTSGIPYGWTGLYPDGVIMSKPIPMAQAKSEHIGKVIATDGKIYESKASAAHAGATPVAMIAYLGNASDCTHGLAFALEDARWNRLQADAAGEVSTWPSYKAVSGGTWRLPSIKDWQYLVIGCSGESYDNYTWNFRKNGKPLKDKLSAAGADSVTEDSYWSSTTLGYNAWRLCYVGDEADFNLVNAREVKYSVRAVLAF